MRKFKYTTSYFGNKLFTNTVPKIVKKIEKYERKRKITRKEYLKNINLKNNQNYILGKKEKNIVIKLLSRKKEEPMFFAFQSFLFAFILSIPLFLINGNLNIIGIIFVSILLFVILVNLLAFLLLFTHGVILPVFLKILDIIFIFISFVFELLNFSLFALYLKKINNFIYKIILKFDVFILGIGLSIGRQMAFIFEKLFGGDGKQKNYNKYYILKKIPINLGEKNLSYSNIYYFSKILKLYIFRK